MRRGSGKRSAYPLRTLEVGESFTVPANWNHTHARLAASQYAHASGKVFTCRKQDDGTMRVWRIAEDQRDIDRRGPDSQRAIPAVQATATPNYAPMPTQPEFDAWLATFPAGSAWTMKQAYSNGYAVMASWVVNYAVRTRQAYSTWINGDGCLVIARGSGSFPLDRP
jgi:hypothetical protein